MTPTLYLVRHGNTDLNDPNNERLRGWSDIPINASGRDTAHLAAKELEGKGIYRVVASDLQRAMLTGQIIGQDLDVEMKPDRGLRPWDLGEYTGKSIKEFAKKLDYFQEFSNMKVPSGEAYKEFWLRWSDALDRMLKWVTAHPDKPLLGVTHSRNLLSLPTILGRKEIGDVPVKGGPQPGSVVVVYGDGDNWHTHERNNHG